VQSAQKFSVIHGVCFVPKTQCHVPIGSCILCNESNKQ